VNLKENIKSKNQTYSSLEQGEGKVKPPHSPLEQGGGKSKSPLFQRGLGGFGNSNIRKSILAKTSIEVKPSLFSIEKGVGKVKPPHSPLEQGGGKSKSPLFQRWGKYKYLHFWGFISFFLLSYSCQTHFSPKILGLRKLILEEMDDE